MTTRFKFKGKEILKIHSLLSLYVPVRKICLFAKSTVDRAGKCFTRHNIVRENHA